jgi:hypothetical protein
MMTMTTVTVLNTKAIKVEMYNTALEMETYWIDLGGVYVDSKAPMVSVTVSRKNGGCAQLNSNIHQTRIGRVCSAARKELQAYVKGLLEVQPQGGFDLRKT